MQHELITYWPTKAGVSPIDVKDAMPGDLKNSLLSGGTFSYGIFIDGNDEDCEARFDAYLNIGRGVDFTKSKILEVDKSEIDSFDYFRISVQGLDETRHFEADLDATNLQGYIASISVRKEFVATHFLFEIFCPFACTCYLISENLKNAFEQAGVDGITYHGLGCDGLFAGVVTSRSSCVADRIVPGPGFEAKTKRVLAPHLFNLRYPVSKLCKSGFQDVAEIEVGDEVYCYRKPFCIVSRRALRTLLDTRAKGLTTATVKIKQKFVPVVTLSDR